MMYPARSSWRLALILLLMGACQYQSMVFASGERNGGDYYTSDLINARIVIGPVAEARASAPDSLINRRVALSTEDIQRNLAEGITEIHRAATVSRVGGKGGLEKSLRLAQEKGADLLILPRIEELTIDQMGKNGLDPVAKFVDVVLFPVTLTEAVIYRGERAGLGSQYLPLNNMVITMRLSMDFYRVSDGKQISRQTINRTLDVKVNNDNLEGARFESTDDWLQVGRDQGTFLVREVGREVAKDLVPELVDRAKGTVKG